MSDRDLADVTERAVGEATQMLAKRLGLDE
jgi:hypothetical protein